GSIASPAVFRFPRGSQPRRATASGPRGKWPSDSPRPCRAEPDARAELPAAGLADPAGSLSGRQGGEERVQRIPIDARAEAGAGHAAFRRGAVACVDGSSGVDGNRSVVALVSGDGDAHGKRVRIQGYAGTDDLAVRLKRDTEVEGEVPESSG